MQLKRVLDLRTIVATSAGLTLSVSTFVAAVQVAGYVLGDSAWIAILTGGVLCLLAAACFSELNGLLPTANGIRLYFSRAFNDQVALVVSLMYMTVVIIGVIGAESFILAQVLRDVFPSFPPYLWVLLLILTVTAMNIRGVRIAGVFQQIVTYGLLASLILFSLFALQKVNFQLEMPFVPGSAEGLINAIALGIFLYVGFEWVTPLAEEVTDVKNISKGMMIAIGILSVTYSVFTVAMTSLVPKELLVDSAAPHMIFAREVLGAPGAAWMVLISLAATVTTFNAGLISVSRFMYASAREQVLPAVFAKVSLRYFTPWTAILALSGLATVVAAATMISGRYLVLVEMAAAIEAIVFMLAGLAVISLRRRAPDQPRPYLIKGNLLVPVLTVIVFALLAAAVLAESLLALIILTAVLAASIIYVKTAIPYLKRKHAERKQQQPRRRRVSSE